MQNLRAIPRMARKTAISASAVCGSAATGHPIYLSPTDNNYQIVQSADHIAILAEMNHELRLIALNVQARTIQSATMAGQSRGHWEGDTLVIETTSLKANTQSRFGVAYDGMSDRNLRVIERLNARRRRSLPMADSGGSDRVHEAVDGGNVDEPDQRSAI